MLARGWHVTIGAIACAVAVSLAGARGAHADEIDDEVAASRANTLATVRATDADAASEAEAGFAYDEAGRHADALAAFERASARLPEDSNLHRWACYQLHEVQRYGEAMSRCERALALSRSAPNLSAMAIVRVAREGRTPEDVRAALDLMDEAAKDGSLTSLSTRCRVLALANRADDTWSCAESLRARAPRSAEGYVLGIISARDHGEAARVLDQARASPMSVASLAEVESVFDQTSPWWAAPARWTRNFFVLWLGLTALVAGLGLALSSLTRKLASELPKTQRAPVPPMLTRLRGVYRVVLWLACLLFYLTLPIMLFLIAALTAGFLYAALAVGRMPIGILVALLSVAALTFMATIRALFVKVSDEDPGERLDLEENPKLHAVLQEVAERMSTRPIDTVFMMPGAELAVFERASLGSTLRGAQAERCLLLGGAVLKGMQLSDFKAVLAHEYGHFKNEDTAGGDFALRARRSMRALILAMAYGGAAVWYNPAWWLLQGFHRLFLRVSHGASRLQEILADRWAAFLYGGAAFERGLVHVIRRSIEFPAMASATLNKAHQDDHAILNIYRKAPPEDFSKSKVDDLVEEALNEESSPYDTHPSPQDRLRLVRALDAEEPAEPSTETAWDLFEDRRTLERQLTRALLDKLRLEQGFVLPKPGASRQPDSSD